MYIKQLSILALALLTSASSQAVEVYFDQDRVDQFACTIARSLKDAYPKHTPRSFRKKVMKLLRKEINPWVDAHPIPAGISLPRYIERVTGLPGFPMDRSEYYMQNAFILFGNPEMTLDRPIENHFASYIHLARKRHIAYLNGEAEKFQLREEQDLLQQIEENLPNVAGYDYKYKDENGKAIKQNRREGLKDKHRYTLAIGKPEHKKYDQFVQETQKYNEFSSPLFLWLLEQEDFSISPEKLFNKALEIYGDPMVALGVIPWVFSGDALTVNRGNSSVVSYKVERVVQGGDVPGYQYHFWGYLTQGIIGNRIRVGTLAYIYEKLYQKDIPDWKVDLLSLRLGKQVRSNLKNNKSCK